jgi:hypothetical protein
VFKLEESDKFTVEQAMNQLFPHEKRVRLKNDLAAAGIID